MSALRRWRAPLLAVAAVLLVLGSVLALAARGEADAANTRRADTEAIQAHARADARSCQLRPHYGC
jgi:hypothetical protein